jgi:hypothetical protein
MNVTMGSMSFNIIEELQEVDGKSPQSIGECCEYNHSREEGFYSLVYHYCQYRQSSVSIMGSSGLPFLMSSKDLPILVIQYAFIHLCLIREEKLLQLLLWKMVHFALFLEKISINFSPSYSTVFFFHHSVCLYSTKISKLYSTVFFSHHSVRLYCTKISKF